MGSGAATFSVPAGSERTAAADWTTSSAARSRCNARSCSSRPSGVSTSERVVRVNSRKPNCCSRRWIVLLTADGDTDSERAAAVKLPYEAARANATMPVRRSRLICSVMALVK